MDPSDRSRLAGEARALLRANDARGLVALLDGAGEAVAAEPEVGFLLATGLRRIGEAVRAYDLVRAIAEACERRGRDQLWRGRLNLEAALLFERGDADAAESAWRVLVSAANEADDHSSLARSYNNLGVICTLQGRWEEALANYGRALAACHRLGDRRGLAQAHQNVAISYRELGFQREADAHFRSAIEDGTASSSEDVVGRAEEERALGFLLADDARLAQATAERSLVRLRRIGDAAGEGEALRVLGLIALAEGEMALADRTLRRALERARSADAVLLEAEILEGLAVFAEGGDGDEDAVRAREIFESFGAAGWAEHVQRRMRLLADRGSRRRRA